MSVSLLVKHVSSTVQSVPVASQAFFRQYWRPLGKTLGLEWIPLFESGIPLDKSDVGLVLAELARLRGAVDTQGFGAADKVRVHMLDRIDLLRRGLEGALRDETVTEIFIG